MRKPKPEPDPEAEFWTPQQAGRYLGLSASAFYHGEAGTNEIDPVRFGAAVRFKKSDVIAFGERMHARAVARRVGRRRFPLAG